MIMHLKVILGLVDAITYLCNAEKMEQRLPSIYSTIKDLAMRMRVALYQAIAAEEEKR